MKTNLEIFNQVRDHLLKQGRRSTDARVGNTGGKTSCKYRASNGDSCAVGCLIPDELYKVGMENSVVVSSIVRSALYKIGIRDPDAIKMLSDLQLLHDSVTSWDNFPHNLNKELEQIRVKWCEQT